LLGEVYPEIREYLRENMGIYIFVSVLFLLGVLLGGLVVRWLNTETMEHLYYSFSEFMESVKRGEELSPGVVLRTSLKQNLLQVLLFWATGLFALGFPFSLALLIFRGFTIGFTVAFLIEKTSYYGILFSLGIILPHNLLIVPAFLVITVTSFSLSFFNFKEKYLEKNKFNLKMYLASYSLLILLMSLVIILGGLVEAYLSQLFMRLMVPIMP